MLDLLVLISLAGLGGEADKSPETVPPIPPAGIAVPEADRAELEGGIEKLEALITELKKTARPALAADVEIYEKAVRYALRNGEIFDAKEIKVARKLIETGLERAWSLKEGKAPWASAVGLVVRGYRSRIDGSAQPYGLVIPSAYSAGPPLRSRLDAWFHGRGEKLSELNFIEDRSKNQGEFAPPNAIVLHLYGRYSNANKFAGEIDLLEALETVKQEYSIDENRIVIRGFSMGGAACWQFAVHYADQWCAAAPGAGFSETADFLKVFQNEKVTPNPWEQTLWHWYDCTDYAANLFNLPVVAYSGEIDKQKQAADMMAAAMKKEDLELLHLIGPKTAHSYEREAKAELSRRIDAIAERGRDPVPRKIRFTTWTLRYDTMFWIRAEALDHHWERARIDAELGLIGASAITQNVSAFSIRMGPGLCPFPQGIKQRVTVDGMVVEPPPVLSDRSWMVKLRKVAGVWRAVDAEDGGGLHKRHGLQGPIDDAFLDQFVMVRPTGKAANEKAGEWAAKEMNHAIAEWRRQFRGDAPVVDDTAVTDDLIKNANLVLWGDPRSNKILEKIAGQLPLADLPLTDPAHLPILIYPNPLNPNRYVVLNSGFTFREYDYLNNARQVPKLPDWAVVDTTTAPTPRWPGKIMAAGFFDEEWKVKK